MTDLSPNSDFARPDGRVEILSHAARDDAQLGAVEAARHSVLGPSRKADFLESLQVFGNVRLAAKTAGVSAQTAYRARRRSPGFARAWDAALVAARAHAEATLADRALNGVEEPVFYHGEEIARRRRYDSRLLLAHIARLDRLEERADIAASLPHLDAWIDALRDGAEIAERAPESADIEHRTIEPDDTTAPGAAPPSDRAAPADEKLSQDRVPSVPDCRESAATTPSLEQRLRAMEAARPRSAPRLADQAASEEEIGLVEALQLSAFEAGEERWWLATGEPEDDCAPAGHDEHSGVPWAEASGAQNLPEAGRKRYSTPSLREKERDCERQKPMGPRTGLRGDDERDGGEYDGQRAGAGSG